MKRRVGRRRSFSMTLLLAAFFVLSSSVLTSCKEENDAVEEFPNWKDKNEKYFDNLYQQTKQKIASGDKSWKILTKWSLNEEIATKAVDHIVVHVLKEGTGSGCPLYTDSVRVNYSGRMLPSTSYPAGFVFDKSYYGDFDPKTAHPVTLAMQGQRAVVDGFSTALQHMHIGDRWEIYIPHQLGYGADGSRNSTTKAYIVQPYSTLIFDVTLLAYYRPGEIPVPFQAKQNAVWVEE